MEEIEEEDEKEERKSVVYREKEQGSIQLQDDSIDSSYKDSFKESYIESIDKQLSYIRVYMSFLKLNIDQF